MCWHMCYMNVKWTVLNNSLSAMGTYSISHEICTQFYCALLCCGYAIVHNEFTWSIYIHQGCFAGTVAIVRLPQCQWSKPDGFGKIGQCITTTKHSKAKTVCIFLGIYCMHVNVNALGLAHRDNKQYVDLFFNEHWSLCFVRIILMYINE